MTQTISQARQCRQYMFIKQFIPWTEIIYPRLPTRLIVDTIFRAPPITESEIEAFAAGPGQAIAFPQPKTFLKVRLYERGVSVALNIT